MSEDRLDKALRAMRDENATPEQVSGAAARVREKLGIAGRPACVEFRAGFGAYIEGRLPVNRRLLMDDHLSRCPQCRAQLAELRGERRVIAMPQRHASRWVRWGGWAAAAAVFLAAFWLGRDRIDTLLAPAGPRATVVSASGELYRVPGAVLQAGSLVGQEDIVRTGPGARAVLRLADGSLVDVNERTELFVRSAWTGQTIHLERGDIIVQAAKQRRGRLRVQTRDSVASVKGTTFAVSAGLGGTLVSVVEGTVAVAQPGVNVVLRPGEQAASKRALSSSVSEAVSWSPDAEKYVALLASFAGLEKEISRLPSQALRTEPRLLRYLPANPVVYGAIPNLGDTISQAMALAEQQAAGNSTFREWWNSGSGQELRQLVERVQTVTPLLGDEIVFILSTGDSGAKDQIPMVVAEIRPGRQSELASALGGLRGPEGNTALPYDLTGAALVVSDSQEHLQWILSRMGAGADTPFAAAIAARYRRGAGWLAGLNMDPALSAVAGGEQAGVLGVQQMKYLFLEQRDVEGVEENEVTLTFNGPRMGLASWLAGTGSGGAAEYLPSKAIFAVYAATREPRQLFDELTTQLARLSPSGNGAFAEAEAKLGSGFAADLAAAFGTESAFAVEGFSVSGPVWILATLVNNPSTIDSSVRRLVDVFNADLAPEDQARRISISQETVDGRTWNTLSTAAFPLSVTWTYDRGYLVAASDRGVAARSIAACSGGSSLVWSLDFQQRMPSSAGVHPSAFAWLNTKGVLEGLATFVSDPTIRKLIAERDPILVVFNGSTEQIHSASRTRISGLVVDAMLLGGLSRLGAGKQTPTLQRGSPETR